MDLFNKITEEEKIELLKELDADILSFKKDNNVLATVKHNNYIGIIIKGNIQIIKEDYNGFKTIEEELSENDLFGTTLSNLSNNEYKLIAKTDIKIIVIEYNAIMNLENKKDYYYQFIKNLDIITNNKLKEKNERIQILTQKTIRNKLLKFFDIASTKNNSKNIYLPFSFTELADFLSVDRSAMSREIGYLKKEGFVEIKGRRISLLNKTRFDSTYAQIHF